MSSSRTDVLVDVTMPQMGVSVAEGTVIAWRVDVGDRIAADETICEISTDKIDTEVPAPATGAVAEILVGVEQTVPVGTVLARIATEGTSDAVERTSETAEVTPTEPQTSANGRASNRGAATRSPAPPARSGRDGGERGRYSPVVQRIAAEHGIDLSLVPGTGRGGRVRKQDVLAFVHRAPEPPLHIESPYRPEPVGAGGQLSRMRRQIGEHMKRSLDTAAHCTTWIEVDMSRVEAARTALGLTALPFVGRATIAALREHPALNAWLEGERYTRHAHVNLGIAVSLGDDGLIVPVVEHAHELSVEGLGARIKDLARRARARELTPDEVQGGTFTITNPGQYGSIMATPIINQPQVAILDLEAVIKRPVVLTDADGNDSIAIRPMTILGLSWDHRALDGAIAAQFLASVKGHLEGWTGA
ncbi:MAG TPA: dihydrolipoamide acetyltransferase family protein [Solirubrobacteraceae bacterium]|nr:dihydrolipoamide acetyltransferase family protein [Solirubrobacteraceae bacterium]